MADAEPSETRRRDSGNGRRIGRAAWSDLAACAALALLGALAVALLAPRNPLRAALAMPVLFLVPGYLLLQIVFGRQAGWGGRASQAVLAVGVSPPVVGVLSLLTLVLPGGMRPAAIVWIVTIGCLALCGAAFLRRAARPAGTGATAPAHTRA